MNRLEIFQEVYGKDYMFTETELSRLHQVAELIVRECIDWCDAHATVDGTATKIAESITEHFGIKGE